jgi:hypothetical protein
MALLQLQDGNAGVAPTLASATGGGDTVPAGVEAGGWQIPVVLVVRNGDATATNVTVAGLAAVSVPGTNGVAVIPVAGTYGIPVGVTYSKVTSLSVAAVRLTGQFE